MLIKKSEAKIVDLGSKIIRKYTSLDKQLEINYMILNGRTPDEKEAFICETKVHFMLLVAKGTGKIFKDSKSLNVKKGDCVDFPPGTRFAAEGSDFEYITAESPAWYKKQARIVDKNGRNF